MADAQPTISTHVLDTGRGRPAAGLKVSLYKLERRRAPDPGERVPDRRRRPGARPHGPAARWPGVYRLRFDVPDGAPVFFRTMAVDFEIVDTSRSYHVPLLLAPFSMSTYRGS